MKISLLIPVFNFDITALVHGMKSAIGKVPEFYEIIIGDDGSSSDYREKYQSLVEEEIVRLISSEKNIGRAAIRNRLALEAAGDVLIFIDADSMLPSTAESYMQNWIAYTGLADVICGGILYRDTPPGDPDKMLRWRFGKLKEHIDVSVRNNHPHTHFKAFNLLIKKTLFEKIRFNEELKQYGCEDTLMSYQLKKAGIEVFHIDNGLVHEGLESNHEFLAKNRQGVENLSKLYDIITDKKAFAEINSMVRVYNKIRYFGLARLCAALFIRYRERTEIRLESHKISIKLFRLYRFCMFCTFREIQIRRKSLKLYNC